MDVSKYKSVSEWRDDLNGHGWNINITAGWALSETIKVLGLSFQEAFDYLVRNKKLVFAGQTSFTDLSFQKLLEEAATVKRIFELPTRDPVSYPRPKNKDPDDIKLDNVIKAFNSLPVPKKWSFSKLLLRFLEGKTKEVRRD